jgi:hypothetical protein
MLAINLPEIVQEVRNAFESYEKALMHNDVDSLIQKFWQHPEAIRFGASENLYGFDQIASFRQKRTPPPQRELFNTHITTIGNDVAVASTEYINAKGERGRQMQTWVRTDMGWRIAAAHISFLPPQTSA